MTSLIRLSAMLLCALFATASCGGGSAMQNMEIRMAQQEKTSADYADRIATLESRLDEELNTVRPAQADLWSTVESMRGEVAALKGQLQEIQVRSQSQSAVDAAQLKERTDRLEMAVRQMASQLGLDVEALSAQSAANGTAVSPDAAQAAPQDMPPGMPPAAVASQQPPAPPAAQETNKDSGRLLYDQAMKAFNSRNYQAALSSWQEFVKTFPRHTLKSNALFWMGECYFQTGDYPKAIVSYDDVITNYPKSAKYPDALLKEGMAFFNMGKDGAGKIRLKDVIDKFPNSPQAKRAQSLLKK